SRVGIAAESMRDVVRVLLVQALERERRETRGRGFVERGPGCRGGRRRSERPAERDQHRLEQDGCDAGSHQRMLRCSPVSEPLPVVLIPGLLDSARLYAEQIPALWRRGAVMVADHTRDDSMEGISRRVLAGAPANLARADSRPMLGGIRVPTLVLVGEGDELTPPERAAEMARAIPGSREVRVPDCGHLSTLERPDEVTRALLAWLEA